MDNTEGNANLNLSILRKEMKKIPSRLNLVGNIYGDFTVTEMLYGYCKDSGKPRTYCRCISSDGDEYIIRADALRSGATKHKKGAGHKIISKNIAGMQFGHLTALYKTDKKENNGSWKWRCQCDCGNMIDVPVHNLIRGHTRSCGHRHRSKHEDFIYDYLSSLQIDFETEYRFDNCRNSNGSHKLPFDFFIPSKNSIIEYDGIHHYEPVNGWGGLDKYNITKENDAIKNKYCKENDISLLRIPYTVNDEEIKKMISSFLNPVTITA